MYGLYDLFIAIILTILASTLGNEETVLCLMVAADSFIIFTIIFCATTVFLRNYTYANKKAGHVVIPYGFLFLGALPLVVAFAIKTGLETNALIGMLNPNDGGFGIGKGIAAFLIVHREFQM